MITMDHIHINDYNMKRLNHAGRPFEADLESTAPTKRMKGDTDNVEAETEDIPLTMGNMRYTDEKHQFVNRLLRNHVLDRLQSDKTSPTSPVETSTPNEAPIVCQVYSDDDQDFYNIINSIRPDMIDGMEQQLLTEDGFDEEMGSPIDHVIKDMMNDASIDPFMDGSGDVIGDFRAQADFPISMLQLLNDDVQMPDVGGHLMPDVGHLMPATSDLTISQPGTRKMMPSTIPQPFIRQPSDEIPEDVVDIYCQYKDGQMGKVTSQVIYDTFPKLSVSLMVAPQTFAPQKIISQMVAPPQMVPPQMVAPQMVPSRNQIPVFSPENKLGWHFQPTPLIESGRLPPIAHILMEDHPQPVRLSVKIRHNGRTLGPLFVAPPTTVGAFRCEVKNKFQITDEFYFTGIDHGFLADEAVLTKPDITLYVVTMPSSTKKKRR